MDEIQRMGELATAAAAEVRRTATSHEAVVDHWVQVLCDPLAATQRSVIDQEGGDQP